MENGGPNLWLHSQNYIFAKATSSTVINFCQQKKYHPWCTHEFRERFQLVFFEFKWWLKSNNAMILLISLTKNEHMKA